MNNDCEGFQGKLPVVTGIIDSYSESVNWKSTSAGSKISYWALIISSSSSSQDGMKFE